MHYEISCDMGQTWVRNAGPGREEPRPIVWFSCGAASAVAARLAVESYPDAVIAYCDTRKFEHPDNERFMREVSVWVGRPITLLRSVRYSDIYDVFDRTGWLVGPSGARCTLELKKRVRRAYQIVGDIHIFGHTADEQARIDRFEKNEPDIDCEWILADRGVSKADCYAAVQAAGIALPMMYRLGYNNNNCIGCVKGQAGYWNKIRQDFPDHFDRMARQERKMGVAINKSRAGGVRRRVFLDELDPNAGRDVPMPPIDCGVLCDRLPDELIGIHEPALTHGP